MLEYAYMKSLLLRSIASLENAPLTFATFAAAFLALILVRLMIENALALFEGQTFFYFFFEFTHTFLFFLCAFLLLLPLVRFAGEVDFRKAANVLLFGFLIILTPPIIDTIIFRGGAFWSFYEFDGFLGLLRRYFTLFGDTPEMGITYGVRVEVVVVTFALGFYAFLKSRRLPKALLVSLITYTVLFILGTFPSWLTLGILVWEKDFLMINQNDVAAVFLTPEFIFSRGLQEVRSILNVKMSLVYGVVALFLIGFTLWRQWPQYFLALWKNARLPQLVYHAGLLFIGMALAFLFTDAPLKLDFFHSLGALLLLAAVESAWLASIVVNDTYDIKTDQATNPARPLIEKTIPEATYKTMGWLFFAASLILSGLISFAALLLLLGYQAIAWLYSAPPYRLKRWPILATGLAAFAGILVLILGFLAVSPENDISALPWPLLFFLFFTYALCLPIKDFKDIRGDALEHVYTLPVLLGAEKAKLLIGSLMFLAYAASPFILSARSLFLPALFFGSLVFWSIQRGTNDERSFFAYRKLPGIVLPIVIVYGFVVVMLLFSSP